MNELEPVTPPYMKFGDTVAERLAVFKRIAEEIYADGKARTMYIWRGHLMRTVADNCRQSYDVVRSTMEDFGPENVAVLRRAYFGEHDPYDGVAKKRKETIARKKASLQTPADTTANEEADDAAKGEQGHWDDRWFVRVYSTALASLPPGQRTRRNLAGRLNFGPEVVDSYLYQHPEFAGELTDGADVLRRDFLFLKKK